VRKLFVSSLLVLLVAAPAAAHEEHAPTTATVSDPTPEQEQEIVVAGNGWQPGTRVEVTLEGDVLGSATVASSGVFEAPALIPSGAPVGIQRLLVAGTAAHAPFSLEIAIQVASGGAPVALVIGGAAAGAVLLPAIGLGGYALAKRRKATARRAGRPSVKATRGRR
jgi:hypothetical protein